MPCPYENNTNLKQLPCHWIEHPHNPELRVCDTCRDYYNLGKIEEKSQKFLDILPWVVLGFIIVSII